MVHANLDFKRNYDILSYNPQTQRCVVLHYMCAALDDIWPPNTEVYLWDIH
jgi:hypothetical protein